VTRHWRWPVGLLLAGFLLGGGALLLRSGIYGLTLFIVMPVILGGLGAWSVRAHTARTAVFAGGYAVLLASLGWLALGQEGALCIAMSLPLSLPLGCLGGLLVYRFEPRRFQAGSATMLLLLPAGTFGWDVSARQPVFEVRSSIEIAASPERVWKHVVTFSELPEPREWYFQIGLAYPKRARIEGSGPGAVRYCEFSTGPFVEPIEVWDEPVLLRFRVTEPPPPMHEWSPYAQVLPKHLHGYLVSKEGQFRLTPLGPNRTLLEGTTWYRHGLWPAEYWRLWSDAIIHRIHLRVLNHIKTLSEAEH
jgi:hypothetical protein